MPQEPGKPKKKLPERGDALKIDLPFDEAMKAALEVEPLTTKPKMRSGRNVKPKLDQ